jgi:hypothetical protein
MILFSWNKDMLTQYRPMHSSSKSLDIEIEEEERHKKSCCMKTLLEAGADVSLEAHSHEHILFSTFMNALFVNSIVNTELHDKLCTMLTLSRPLLNTY